MKELRLIPINNTQNRKYCTNNFTHYVSFTKKGWKIINIKLLSEGCLVIKYCKTIPEVKQYLRNR